MNQFKDIELFIFDCDGVLVDTEELANRVFIEEITKLGFHLSPEEAWEHFPGTRFAKCVEYVESTNHKKVPEEFLETYRNKSQHVFDTEMQAIPGIINILERLHLPKVVASNGPMRGIVANLTTAALLPYFHPEDLFSAYDIQKWKPDPEMHLHVSKTKGIDPTKCLVIEDSEAGIMAAIAAGMHVIGFTHDNRNHKLAPLNITKIAKMEELISLVPHALSPKIMMNG